MTIRGMFLGLAFTLAAGLASAQPPSPAPAAAAATPVPDANPSASPRPRISPSPQGSPRPGLIRYQSMDKNNDGRISREEWRGNDQSFANKDTNGDGVLSGSEVAPLAMMDAGTGSAKPSPSPSPRD